MPITQLKYAFWGFYGVHLNHNLWPFDYVHKGFGIPIADLECIFQSIWITYDWETWITYTGKIMGDSKEWGKE